MVLTVSPVTQGFQVSAGILDIQDVRGFLGIADFRAIPRNNPGIRGSLVNRGIQVFAGHRDILDIAGLRDTQGIADSRATVGIPASVDSPGTPDSVGRVDTAGFPAKADIAASVVFQGILVFVDCLGIQGSVG